MTEIPRDTLERWALEVHRWLMDPEHAGTGVIADAMVGTGLDRRAVLAGIQVLRDEGLWVIQVDDRGRIRAAQSTDPMFTRPEHRTSCAHRNTIIDARQRIVSCTKCGDLLDPFDVLNEVANAELRWTAATDRAERQARDATRRLADVERQEANAKARVRTAQTRATELEHRIRQLSAELEGLERLTEAGR